MTQNDLFGKSSIYPADFQRLWKLYPKRPGNPKIKALRAYQKNCMHYQPDRIAEGVKRYRSYCDSLGIIGTVYVMHAATFFGPSLHFLEDWDQPDRIDYSDQWNQIVTAASSSSRCQREFMAGCDEKIRAAINAVGGLKWIGTRNSYDLKRVKDQFQDEMQQKAPTKAGALASRDEA